MVDHSLYPICDTNILIALNLGKVLDHFLGNIKKLNVADKVKDEMENKFSQSDSYNHFLNVFHGTNVIVINETMFSEDVLKSIRATLRQYKVQNFVGIKAYGKDAGEFASALYAVNLGIKKFYTNDKVFIKNYGQEYIFKDLTLVNLNSTLSEFLTERERIRVNAIIEKNNPIMVFKLDEESKEVAREELLQRLVAKFNH